MSSVRPRLFIGSSKEGKGIAEAIQANLDYDCECVIWHQGLFGLGGGTLESLLDEIPTHDFAVLVLTPDDLIESRGNKQASPRDNVLLELGMCLAALGRHRAFVVYDRSSDTKLPSDLAGATKADYEPHSNGNHQAALGRVCYLITAAIKKHGTKIGKSSPTAIPTAISKSTAGTPTSPSTFAGYPAPRYQPTGIPLQILEMYHSLDTVALVQLAIEKDISAPKIAVVDAIEELIRHNVIEHAGNRAGGAMYQLTAEGRRLVLGIHAGDLISDKTQQSREEVVRLKAQLAEILSEKTNGATLRAPIIPPPPYKPIGIPLEILKVFYEYDQVELPESSLRSHADGSRISISVAITELITRNFLTSSEDSRDGVLYRLTHAAQLFVANHQWSDDEYVPPDEMPF
jgi:hypothetical protein